MLQRWKIICNDKNNTSQIGNFVKSRKTSSETDHSGGTTKTFFGDAFLYIETSSNNNTASAYVILESTDVIQITNFSFYYNRYSILTNDSLKSMARFRVQLLLSDNTWSTNYQLSKNSIYSSSSTEREFVKIDFTEPN